MTWDGYVLHSTLYGRETDPNMAHAENVNLTAESSNISNELVNIVSIDDKEESETPEVLHQFFDTQARGCETSEEFIELFFKLKARNRYQSSN